MCPSDSQPDTMQQSPGKRLFLCLFSGCGVRFNKLLSSATNQKCVFSQLFPSSVVVLMRPQKKFYVWNTVARFWVSELLLVLTSTIADTSLIHIKGLAEQCLCTDEDQLLVLSNTGHLPGSRPAINSGEDTTGVESEWEGGDLNHQSSRSSLQNKSRGSWFRLKRKTGTAAFSCFNKGMVQVDFLDCSVTFVAKVVN